MNVSAYDFKSIFAAVFKLDNEESKLAEVSAACDTTQGERSRDGSCRHGV